jgi:type III restriction enzyme
VYRLDAVDAYERKLVKQIEVASVLAEGGHNRAYVKLLKTENRKGPVYAEVEIDAAAAGGGVKRKKVKVRAGDDLFDLSGRRELYRGFRVDDISCAAGGEGIKFTHAEWLLLGRALNDGSELDIKRLQIRKTIEEHLRREKLLRPQGIKVLSLFFIDRVANYRAYDAEGRPTLGRYAQIFEEEYVRACRRPEVQDLFVGQDPAALASQVHDGYFASDKRRQRPEPVQRQQPRGQYQGRRERLPAYYARQRAPAEHGHPAPVYLLALGAARGLGQPQRISNLHAQRNHLGGEKTPRDRPRAEACGEPAGRAGDGLRGQHPHRDCQRIV